MTIDLHRTGPCDLDPALGNGPLHVTHMELGPRALTHARGPMRPDERRVRMLAENALRFAPDHLRVDAEPLGVNLFLHLLHWRCG